MYIANLTTAWMLQYLQKDTALAMRDPRCPGRQFAEIVTFSLALIT